MQLSPLYHHEEGIEKSSNTVLGPAFGQFPRAQKKKNGGAILHLSKNWAHKGQLPIFEFEPIF